MQCGVYIVVTRIPFVAGCFYNALRGTYFLLTSVYIGVRGTYYNVIAAVFTMLWWEHTFLLALFISAPRCSRNNAAASLPVLATVWSNVSPATEQIMCHRSPTTSYSAHVTYNNTTVKHITMFKRNKLFSIGNKGKGMILYIALYTIRWTAQRALHFTPWQTCSFWHLLNFAGKHSAMLQLRRRDYSLTFPTLSVARYLVHISANTLLICNAG